ncbi:ATP-binding cassette domain-containing protein [Actinomadura nitritigenes]|uniref:ATP-binding cassette domain-containing protein n=1 Tax=Actinomadura nitritigenes TaxID=134602 RepID=A0ABS3RG67_9ACTN|nr:ATP-binding cassette domain-containing protein [Actinomadura nitritigenes]MBO2445037.1 ATP-binding cassette domain-containing protein [Actinomadura nitritigenes]
MIEADALVKRYGGVTAVDGLSFTAPSGSVTGFLGPNGAGKSTTMRMILGLDAPTAGSVTVNGRPYTGYRRPLREVGALLDAKAVAGGRSARDHLMWLALSNGIPRSRVDEVLGQVGLAAAARKKVGGFSLGMAQRLGIAAALLGDPPVLMFDEPVNGLDPDGVAWIRTLLKSLAGEGRTVFLSSHLMSEMALTADRLVIIGRGRLIAETTVADLLAAGGGNHIRVRSAEADDLARLLTDRGAAVGREPDGALRVTGATADEIGDLARARGLGLLELSPQRMSLEQRYMELTRDAADYRSGDSAPTLSAK